MALASMISGVCLANSGLALAHGIASGMGAVIDLPHGLICGLLLPHTLKLNRDACEEELHLALAAFLNQKSLNGNPISRGIQAIEDLNNALGIPPDFKSFYIPADKVILISEKSMGSSMSGNPIPMTPELIYTFLQPLV